jgi:two-component system sensor kinase FixL
MELSPDLPTVTIDSVQIQQVLVNLIKNACESAREIPVERRRLLIRTLRPESASVEILVQDQGPGVDAAIVGQVFDTFFTTKPTGLGLGLAISRSLVEDHGGRLTMTSNLDRGVTFHCRLPTLGPKS